MFLQKIQAFPVRGWQLSPKKYVHAYSEDTTLSVHGNPIPPSLNTKTIIDIEVAKTERRSQVRNNDQDWLTNRFQSSTKDLLQLFFHYHHEPSPHYHISRLLRTIRLFHRRTTSAVSQRSILLLVTLFL